MALICLHAPDEYPRVSLPKDHDAALAQLAGKRFVIAGGSGFLGMSLAQFLIEQGATVQILSRSAPKSAGSWQHVAWNGRDLNGWQQCLEQADGLINLAGRTVDCIKTPDHQDEILRSRVESTSALGQAMQELNEPPDVWVQMSTAHIYGDPPSAEIEEDSPTGYGLAPFVGHAWEEALSSGCLPGQRTVTLRTSFVVGRNRGGGGGAFSRLRALARLGLAGTIGGGQQGMSWLHELDFNRIVARALMTPDMHGVYIASAPQPESQREFMRQLRIAVGVPLGLPAPASLVRFGAHFFLRTDPDLILYGRYVIPRRLLDEGFEFRFPTLAAALQDLCQPA